MASTAYLGLPPVPAELKSVVPYMQRADELAARDPIMSYWCVYAAAQTGIAFKSKAPPARNYLYSLLSLLERMKADVVTTLGKSGGADAVEDEAASAAYVENFALRVFEGADSEDRKGLSTRATAKKFLAAANFLEMLKIFDKSVVPDTHDEKIRYAKWKAADIARAFREGRKPTPGPAGSKSPEVEVGFEPASPPPTSSTSPIQAPPSAASTSPKLAPSSPPRSPKSSSSSPSSKASRKTPSPKMNSQDIQRANAISPPTEPATYSYPMPHSHIPKHLQDIRPSSPAWSTVATPGTSDGSVQWDPNVNPPLPPSALFQQQGKSDASKSPLGDDGAVYRGGDGLSTSDAQPSAPSPPTPPTPKRVHFTPSVIGGLTESDAGSTLFEPEGPQQPPTAPGFVVPPPGVLAGPSAVTDGIPLLSGFVPNSVVPNQPRSAVSPTTPSFTPSAPPPTVSSPPSQPPFVTAHVPLPPPPPPPPPVLPAAPPEPVDLSPQAIAQTQKHCRYAISALDYEDVETARKELRIALGMLGGL